MSNFVEIKDKDGVTLGQLPVSKEGGRLRNVIYMTESGTYTKPDWLKFVIVECQGASGSTGGRPATSAGQISVANPTGGGGYCKKKILAASLSASETVTVGVGGAVVTGSETGNAGGSSSFGTHCTAEGSPGNVASAAASAINTVSGTGGAATGGDINIRGQASSRAQCSTTDAHYGLLGGSSVLGFGGTYGSRGTGYGSGIGGMLQGASQPASNGIPGNDGIVIIEEYE